MRDRAEPDEIAGQVLIIVAMDVMGVGTGGGGMADGHAGDDSNRKPLCLRFVRYRGDLMAVHVDIDRIVVGLDAAAQGRSRGRRIGIGMLAGNCWIDARQAHGIKRIVPRRPRIGPHLADVVAPRLSSARIENLLHFDVGLRSLVVGCRHHEAELSGSGCRILLKMRAGATPRTIGDRPSIIDCRGPGRLPVHAVEHDQEHMFLAGGEPRPLQCRKVGLIEIIGLGVDGVCRHPAIDSLERIGAAVDAAGFGIAAQVDPLTGRFGAESIDRNQPVGMRLPANIVVGQRAPMPERRFSNQDRLRLQIANEIVAAGYGRQRPTRREKQREVADCLRIQHVARLMVG